MRPISRRQAHIYCYYDNEVNAIRERIPRPRYVPYGRRRLARLGEGREQRGITRDGDREVTKDHR